MRPSVEKVQQLGIMPGDDITAEHMGQWENAVCSIERPVTDEEAVVLIGALPREESSCYGLAWALLHACETAPGYSESLVEQSGLTGMWKDELLQRLRNAG